MMLGRPPGRPCMLLIDANARVGSVTSGACGPHWPQREDEPGATLRLTLESIGMALPRTFH
eukprot:3162614-Lingulodinium_polyedra.AAC.1